MRHGRRATVLCRAAFLVAQLDLGRAYELVGEALRILEPLGDDVDPDLLANVLLLHASAALGLVKGIDTAEIERGTRLITEAGRAWEHDGADGIALGLARQMDDLDLAIAMTERLIRAKAGPGGDDPFNYVLLSGLQVFRGDWAAARANAEVGLEGYAREGAEVFPSWGLRGMALVAAHDGRTDEARRLATEGLELAIARGDLALQIYHRHILGFIALSLGDHRDRRRGADDRRDPGRGERDAASGPVQGGWRPARGGDRRGRPRTSPRHRRLPRARRRRRADALDPRDRRPRPRARRGGDGRPRRGPRGARSSPRRTRPPADAVRARPHPPRQGPGPPATQGEAAGRCERSTRPWRSSSRSAHRSGRIERRPSSRGSGSGRARRPS